MLLFDFSDQEIKVVGLSPKLLGGEAINSYLKVPLKAGLVVRRQSADPQKLAQEVREIIKKGEFKMGNGETAALSLHDERVFTLRLKVGRTSDGKDVLKYIDTQVETFIPESAHDIVSSFKPAAIGSPGEVQFIAAAKELILGYKEVFKALDLNLTLVVPESYALYRLISPSIGLGETVLFLNLEDTAADFIVADKEGVLQTFTDSPDPASVERKIAAIFSYMEKRWARKITKLWLGGTAIKDGESLAKKLKLEAVRVEVALSSYPLKFAQKGSTANTPEAAHLLGLALLTKQKDALNLVDSV
ncbi:MAG: hypothetical protein UY40_C0008G0015 [candidate division CPR1 bacterium GW2011_GWC1_49_13]|uniref:Type IV pilus assembly protein PilM n=1 Tax=candidate division CPR1 bacterium GW2011_GWC1_49_13 TaxID=1618342 RepID=A0A0G1VGV7_9BACT|nr:MAG: hypothetical protein UY40_C0008G0015 [candidate division CPR1 bacterium GW2011_GWC1_49_13]